MSDVQQQAEAGYLFQGLTARIKDVLPKKLHSKMDAWMENVETRLTPKFHGVGGYTMYFMEYHAVFSFERFPFREFDPNVLFANVLAYLMDVDPFRENYELDDPTIGIEPERENTAEVEIDVHFIEPVTVLEDESGNIFWGGKRYSLAPYEVWVAEHGEVIAGGAAAPIGSDDV